MKNQLLKPALAAFGIITLLSASSCRNTAHGVVNDTRRNTNKVGQGVEHVGNKIGQGVERTGEKIQDSTH